VRTDYHPGDGPFDEVVANADRMLAQGSITVWQKFTCSYCGVRQTMDTPDTFYKTGRCEECGLISNLELQGCGFTLIKSATPELHDEIVETIQKIHGPQGEPDG